MCFTTVKRLVNIKVIGPRLRSHGFLCFCAYDTVASSGQYLLFSLELGLTVLFIF